MYKNESNQYVYLFAWDKATGTPKINDAPNISTFITNVAASGGATSNSVSEVHSTQHPGVYALLLTAAETNKDFFTVSAISITADVSIEPVVIYTKERLLPLLTAVNAKTTNLPVDPASETNVSANGTVLGTIDGKADAIGTGVGSIVSKLPSGNISGMAWSDPFDGETASYILQLVMAMVNGRFKKNTPAVGEITFYKRDNITPLTITKVVTDSERTRTL